MLNSDFSYALCSPLSALIDKAPQNFERADFIKVIEQKKIERITFHYTALDGKLKELRLPVSNRKQAESVLAEGERVDGSSLFKGMVGPSLSDLYVVPEYKTAFLNPFDQGSLDFICRYLTKDGERAPFALDNILKKAVELFRESTGLELYALGELEFFVIGKKENNIFPLLRQQGYHASAPFMKSSEILNEIVRLNTQITGAVKYAHSENGSIDTVQSTNKEIDGKRAEQLEMEFLAKPVEEMADALVLARWLIRNVAYRHGCTATFTPKLEEGVAGNGLHFHLELKRADKNIMVGSGGKLSEPALCLIGGLIEYADSLTAFGNTLSSSYLRLVSGQEAPTRIWWSDLNRNALIRIPLAWSNLNNLSRIINLEEKTDVDDSESRQTVELRTPDGSALIHLLLAGVVMAAEWGFRQSESLRLAKKFYAKADAFADKKALQAFPLLPASCVESSRILLKKRSLYERKGIFPAAIIEYMAKLLRAEDDERLGKRLSSLSGKARLREMQKAMHKDLHRH
jgi:glutamine synthetase